MRALSTLLLLGMYTILFSQTSELFLEVGESDQYFCPGTDLELSINTNGTSVMWSTGESTSTITVNSSETFFVTVSDGSTELTDSIIVTELITPGEAIITGPFEICGGNPDTLWANAPLGQSYVWSTGDTTEMIIITEPDQYEVTVTNTCDDTVSTNRFVEDLPDPEIEIYFSGELECPNDQVILSIDSPYGLELNWWNGSSEAYTSVGEPGVYWVEAFNECGSDTDSITITSDEKPYPELHIMADNTLLCGGESATLFANTNTDGFLVWSTGYVAFDSIVVDSPGVYEAYFINDCGRVDASISISGPPDLEVGINAPEDMCEGSPEILTAQSANAVSFEWSDGTEGTQMETTVPGSYTVTVTGICGEKSSATHYIAGVPYPTVEIRQEEELMCDGAVITLIADAMHADEYYWSTGETSPEIPIESRGFYGVVVNNRCFEASDEILLPTVPVPAFVPNVFSPNGDDKNDFFHPLLACSEARDYHFRIFSRWGEMVFNSKNINNGWDGRLNGAKAARGVYVWLLDFNIRDREYHLSGDVMLMR